VNEPSLSSVMPAPKRPRWPLLVLVAALLIVAGGVGGYLLLRPSTLTISGVLELRSASTATDGGHCSGTGGYSDIAAGADVTVTDAAGTIVAIGALGAGTIADMACAFPFSVSAPAGKGFYGLTIGHRSKVQYSESALAQPVHLSLGS